MKVLILGAGGPVAKAAISALKDHHELLLTDLKPLERTHLPTRTVDVTDPRQVEEVAHGMDAIINCTVNRHDRKLGWDVSTRGCYNALRAAVKNGIRRFIHTSPILMLSEHPGSYHWDFDIDERAPARPGTGLYFMTKHLAHELCAIFADRYDIQIVSFHYCGFSGVRRYVPGFIPFYTHPEDAGQAFRLALEAPPLPHKFEVFHISAEFPHDQYPITKAKEILGFKPKHTFEKFFRKPQPPRAGS